MTQVHERLILCVNGSCTNSSVSIVSEIAGVVVTHYPGLPTRHTQSIVSCIDCEIFVVDTDAVRVGWVCVNAPIAVSVVNCRFDRSQECSSPGSEARGMLHLR